MNGRVLIGGPMKLPFMRVMTATNIVMGPLSKTGLI